MGQLQSCYVLCDFFCVYPSCPLAASYILLSCTFLTLRVKIVTFFKWGFLVSAFGGSEKKPAIIDPFSECVCLLPGSGALPHILANDECALGRISSHTIL